MNRESQIAPDSLCRGSENNFIDVGANIGYFSCLMSFLAGPAGRVLAVEPEPGNLKLLESNVECNHLTNVEIHACAVGASEGSAMWDSINHPIVAATRS